MTFFCINDKKTLLFTDQKKFEDYLAKMPERLTVHIEAHRFNRSKNQNDYYHKCIVRELSDHTGYTELEMHDFLRQKFLRKIMVVGNESENVPRSTRSLSTKEFEDYCRDIRQWASSELGVFLAQPNERNY